MSMFPRLTPLIAALPSTVPFVGPEAIERNRGLMVKARIGANESGFGPAPSVLATVRDRAAEMWKYADPENFELRQALGAHLGIAPEHLAIGEGIDSLLGLIVRMVIDPGQPVVTSLGGYPTFNFHVNGFGGRLVTVPYAGDREDLGGLLETLSVKIGVVTLTLGVLHFLNVYVFNAIRRRSRMESLRTAPVAPQGHVPPVASYAHPYPAPGRA